MSTKQKNFPAKSKPKSPSNLANQKPANIGAQHNSVEVRQAFSGPLPHPSILEGYEKIVPGAAERIIAMAESDMKHQQEIDREALRIAESQVKRGQISAFWLTIIALAVCIFALMLGYEIAASVIAGTTIVALVTAFVVGRKDND